MGGDFLVIALFLCKKIRLGWMGTHSKGNLCYQFT